MENPIIQKYERWDLIFQKSTPENPETLTKYVEYLNQFPFDTTKAISYITLLIKTKETPEIEKK